MRVALIACSKTKLRHAAPARELYASQLFRLARAHAEREYEVWYVLSAEHGLVEPSRVLEPYDRTLGDLLVPERREWGRRIAEQLVARHGTEASYDCYAGARYRRNVIPELERRGAAHVVSPLAGMRIGAQLAWFRGEAGGGSGRHQTTARPVEKGIAQE